MSEKPSVHTLPRKSEAIEEAILGAIMLDAGAMKVVYPYLKPEMFYVEAHRVIYKACKWLYDKGEKIDLLTVTFALKEDIFKLAGPLVSSGDGEMIGSLMLIDICNRVASAANLEAHARILVEYYIQRRLAEIGATLAQKANNVGEDAFNLLADTERELEGLRIGEKRAGWSTMGEMTATMMRRLEELYARGEGLTGLPTGFSDLDRLTGGFQNTDLIVLAARPGMGKTSLMLAIAKNAALMFGKRIAVFSLEMSKLQLTFRLYSLDAKVSAAKLRDGNLSDSDYDTLQGALLRVSDAPIFVDDRAGITIEEVTDVCRKIKEKYGLDGVCVDYLQLIRPSKREKSGNREQEVSGIARGLKGMAKELDVPVIALSQLSRAVETRGGSKRPQLSDLRESGSVEQEADIVAFIWRAEYYGILEDEAGNSLRGIGELIIAKHRNGGLGTVKIGFNADFAEYYDLVEPADAYDFSELMPTEKDIPF